MALGVDDWFEIVRTHYGSLDKFDDATSVRNMLRIISAWLAYEDETIALVPGEPPDPRYATRQQQKRELETWLADRGLTL